MAILEKGSFSLNLDLLKVRATVSDLDRQCAWELYTEMSTLMAVTGKLYDEECTDFSGELLVESLDSLYAFFKEARLIMRRFPVGKIDVDDQNHLGVMISQIFQKLLRPFLEKWQADYRHWWQHQSNPNRLPFERQKQYPQHESFLNDWTCIRGLMRKTMRELVKAYRLVDISANIKQSDRSIGMPD